jgi:hypothetical protein
MENVPRHFVLSFFNLIFHLLKAFVGLLAVCVNIT